MSNSSQSGASPDRTAPPRDPRPFLNRRLLWFWLVAVVCLLLASGLFWHRVQVQQSARTTVIDLSAAMFRDWTVEPLLNQGTSDLRDQLSRAGWQAAIDALRGVGTLQRLDRVSGTVTLPPRFPLTDAAATAELALSMAFDNSTAVAYFTLRRQDGQWWVEAFRFQSPLTDN